MMMMMMNMMMMMMNDNDDDDDDDDEQVAAVVDADLVVCSASFSHLVKVYCFMFVHKISTRVFFVITT